MAKFTKFGLTSSGELVYRKTGKLAPSDYSVRGSTVYGRDGRKVGQIGKGTKTEQTRIRRAQTRRRQGPNPLYKTPHKVSTVKGTGKIKQVFDDISKARRRAKQLNKLQGPVPLNRFDGDQMRKLGESVRSMGMLSAGNDRQLREKINAMSDENLTQLYNDLNGELVFEVYFDYGSISKNSKGLSATEDSKKNARVLVDAYERKFGVIET